MICVCTRVMLGYASWCVFVKMILRSIIKNKI